MHEMLHWSVGARLPIVLTNVSRAMAPGWSIWSDQSDILSQRDVGWMMLFAESVQEAQDFIIWMYRVAEQVFLPGMVGMDAFILSHTAEPLIVHDQDAVDAYLPPFEPLYSLDPTEPRAYGGLVNRDHYYELRYKIYENMERAGGLLVEAGEEFWRSTRPQIHAARRLHARRCRLRVRLRRRHDIKRSAGGSGYARARHQGWVAEGHCVPTVPGCRYPQDPRRTDQSGGTRPQT